MERPSPAGRFRREQGSVAAAAANRNSPPDARRLEVATFTASACRIPPSQLTLQEVTPATRLLEKRRQQFEADERLEAAKTAYATQARRREFVYFGALCHGRCTALLLHAFLHRHRTCRRRCSCTLRCSLTGCAIDWTTTQRFTLCRRCCSSSAREALKRRDMELQTACCASQSSCRCVRVLCGLTHVSELDHACDGARALRLMRHRLQRRVATHPTGKRCQARQANRRAAEEAAARAEKEAEIGGGCMQRRLGVRAQREATQAALAKISK